MPKAKMERKKWPPHKYWTEFLMQDGSIWRKQHNTIDTALALIIMSRDGKNHSEKEIQDFAEYLSHGRNQAIDMLWASGNERYILGHGRIEAITNNPEDREEHFSRQGQMLDQRKMGARRKSYSATPKQIKQFGLPTGTEIKQSSRRLLSGNVNFDTHIKMMETSKDIYFCKQCHQKFLKPKQTGCPFCQSTNLKIV